MNKIEIDNKIHIGLYNLVYKIYTALRRRDSIWYGMQIFVVCILIVYHIGPIRYIFYILNCVIQYTINILY